MLNEIPPARLTQLGLAASFLSFGAAWLVSPDSLATLFSRGQPGVLYPVVTLGLSLLGVQALALGAFALCARFKSWTFLGFAVAMFPLFFADYWLYAIARAFNELILVHAGGMAAALAMCAHGFRVMREREDAVEQLPFTP